MLLHFQDPSQAQVCFFKKINRQLILWSSTQILWLIWTEQLTFAYEVLYLYLPVIRLGLKAVSMNPEYVVVARTEFRRLENLRNVWKPITKTDTKFAVDNTVNTLTLRSSIGDRLCKFIVFILVGEAKGDISRVLKSSEFAAPVGASMPGNRNFARTAGFSRVNFWKCKRTSYQMSPY